MPPALVAAPVVSVPTRAREGQLVRLTGAGFRPKSQVKIVFEAPKREVVGSAVISRDGGFDASVVVPVYATPGQHKVQVVGRAPSGQTMTWVEPVTVLAASPIVAVSADSSDLAPPVLLTLALTFPVATWLVLEILALRQRRAGGTTNGR
jgi:hypothetical protein